MTLRSFSVGMSLACGVVFSVVACGSSDSSSTVPPGGDEAGAGGADTPAAGGGAGGEGPMSGGGEGGSGDGACQALPSNIEEDLEVGPGCVLMGRTHVGNGATLTLAPGTEVRVAPDGYLLVDDSATLTAVGTESDPILFTSAAASPAPGDWQCIRFDNGSSASELQFVTLEYGGQACDANGAGKEGTLVISAGIKNVSQVTITDSSTHAIEIEHNANARNLQDITFARNGKASLLVSLSEVLTLGDGLVFEDAGDEIEVDTTFTLGKSGNWLAQPVPFRIVGGAEVNDKAEVIMNAGLKLEMTGGSFVVFNSNLLVEGSATDPVVFTSAAKSPSAGDWGCISFESVTGTPNIDHAVIEYAGSGAGCTGANYLVAVNAPASAKISNTTFSEIAGVGIRSAGACTAQKAQWCSNTFEGVTEAEVSCNLDKDVGCP